jgi:phi LC3 family holin
MNFKKRIRNKSFWVSMIAAIVPFIYQVLGICGVVAPVSSSDVVKALGLAFNVLVAAGVLVDPTTPGIKDPAADDSERGVE